MRTNLMCKGENKEF